MIYWYIKEKIRIKFFLGCIIRENGMLVSFYDIWVFKIVMKKMENNLIFKIC